MLMLQRQTVSNLEESDTPSRLSMAGRVRGVYSGGKVVLTWASLFAVSAMIAE